MSLYRFYSDASQDEFEATLKTKGVNFYVQANAVELIGVDGEMDDLALSLGATQEPGPEVPNSSTGVEGFQDMGAFSVRSDAAKMPNYYPEPVTTVFYKTPRRTTRSQP